ncbi:hypothetical protein ACXR6G_05920 [Ancylomarina sp. YFZ004]
MEFSRIKKVVFSLSVFCFSLVVSLSAQSLKVLPASLDFKLSKGETKCEEISVINTIDKAENFVIKVEFCLVAFKHWKTKLGENKNIREKGKISPPVTTEQ